MRILSLPVNDIIPNPEQPRKSIRKIDELAASMAEIGQITPVSVFKLSAKQKKEFKTKVHFMLANGGERRWTAAKFLKWKTLKAVIEEPNPFAMLAENMARDEMCIIEKVGGMARALEKEFGTDWKVILLRVHNSSKCVDDRQAARMERLCHAAGMAPTTLYLSLPVLKISENSKKTILENLDYFTDGVVRKLAGIDDEKVQETVTERIVRNHLTGGQAMSVVSKASYKYKYSLTAEEARFYEIMESWRKNYYGTNEAIKDMEEFEKIPEEFKSKVFDQISALHESADSFLKKFKVKA